MIYDLSRSYYYYHFIVLKVCVCDMNAVCFIINKTKTVHRGLLYTFVVY